MSNLPLTWADKINSPLLDDFISKHGAEYCLTAEEINQIRDAINEMAVVQQSVFMGGVIPADIPIGIGNRFWFTVIPGIYTNHGGVVVNANSMAIISVTAAGVFTVSQTLFDISGKVNTSDIINNLTDSSTAKPLSAAQGKILNEKNNINLVPNANTGIENIALLGNQATNHSWQNQNGTPTMSVITNFEGFDKVVKFNLKVGDRVNYYSQFTQLNGSIINALDSASAGMWVKVPLTYTGTISLNLMRTGNSLNGYANNEFVQFANGWRFYRLNAAFPLSAVTDNLVWIYASISNVAGTAVSDIYISNPVILKTPVKIEPSFYKGLDTYILPAVITDKIALIDTKADLVAGTNLFDKNSVGFLPGKNLNPNDGTYAPVVGHDLTGFIEIPIGTTQITVSFKHKVVFYDANKVFISGSSNTITTPTLTVPVNAKYVIAQFYTNTDGVSKDTFMLVAGAVLPSSYIPFGKVVPMSQLNIQGIEQSMTTDYTRLFGKKWCSYGDSITAANGWQPTVLSKISGLTHYLRGIGSSTATENGLIAWVDANGAYLSRPPAAQPVGSFEIFSSMSNQQRVNTIPTDSNIITIMAGSNDISLTLGTIEDTTTATFYGAYQIMLDRIYARIPTAEIVLVTFIHNGNLEHTLLSADGKRPEDFREAIRKIGLKYKYRVIEMGECGINKNNYTSFLSDGVHPNSAGYERMSRLFLQEFKKIY